MDILNLHDLPYLGPHPYFLAFTSAADMLQNSIAVNNQGFAGNAITPRHSSRHPRPLGLVFFGLNLCLFSLEADLRCSFGFHLHLSASLLGLCC